jgi:uncharacterized surface protein with fasciclin (FAS1) repeats
MHKIIATAALIASVLASGQVFAADNVVEAISHNPNLSMTSQFIQQAGLADMLSGSGPFVVFAPTNDAYKAMPKAKLDELVGNKDMLKSLLAYHVVPGTTGVASMQNGMQKTAAGQQVSVYRAGGTITVENAVVTRADIKASNGAVEVIDTVMVPPAK